MRGFSVLFFIIFWTKLFLSLIKSAQNIFFDNKSVQQNVTIKLYSMWCKKKKTHTFQDNWHIFLFQKNVCEYDL